MFSKDILPLIMKHDFFLFGGTSEWPENVYGRDAANHYERRHIRRPLAAESHLSLAECAPSNLDGAVSVGFEEDGSIRITRK